MHMPLHTLGRVVEIVRDLGLDSTRAQTPAEEGIQCAFKTVRAAHLVLDVIAGAVSDVASDAGGKLCSLPGAQGACRSVSKGFSAALQAAAESDAIHAYQAWKHKTAHVVEEGCGISPQLTEHVIGDLASDTIGLGLGVGVSAVRQAIRAPRVSPHLRWQERPDTLPVRKTDLLIGSIEQEKQFVKARQILQVFEERVQRNNLLALYSSESSGLDLLSTPAFFLPIPYVPALQSVAASTQSTMAGILYQEGLKSTVSASAKAPARSAQRLPTETSLFTRATPGNMIISRQVAVYAGPGADSTCVQETIGFLQRVCGSRYAVVPMDAAQLAQQRVDLYVLPGGSMWKMAEALHRSEKMRSSIRQGSGVLAQCAGAITVSSHAQGSLVMPDLKRKIMVEFANASDLLNLGTRTFNTIGVIPGLQVASDGTRSCLVTIAWAKEHFPVFWSDGPVIASELPGTTVLAKYPRSHPIVKHAQLPSGIVPAAALLTQYGQGRVVSLGVHPELARWYNHHHLHPMSALEIELNEAFLIESLRLAGLDIGT